MPTHPPRPAACLWDVLAPADDPRDPLATMHLVAALPDRPVALELAGEHARLRLLARAADARGARALAGAVYAAFPQADLRPVAPDDDPARPAGPGERAAAREFVLREPEALPLRTFDRADAERQGDPLAVLARAFDGLAPGERLVLRLTLRPAPRGWARGYLRAARAQAAPRADRPARGALAGDLALMGLILLGTLALVAWKQHGGSLASLVALWAALPTHHPVLLGLAAGLLVGAPAALVALARAPAVRRAGAAAGRPAGPQARHARLPGARPRPGRRAGPAPPGRPPRPGGGGAAPLRARRRQRLPRAPGAARPRACRACGGAPSGGRAC